MVSWRRQVKVGAAVLDGEVSHRKLGEDWSRGSWRGQAKVGAAVLDGEASQRKLREELYVKL